MSFVSLVLLTAAAAGLPAVWLIRRQLERQAWDQVDRGSMAAQSLFSARQDELTNLATLTAQRPTLNQLVSRGELDRLPAYLGTLQATSGLDTVLICGADGLLIVQAGVPVPGSPCVETKGAGAGYYISHQGSSPQVWMYATHSLSGESGAAIASVMAARRLDDRFLQQMRDQTGLEHTLLLDGRTVATSLVASSERATGNLGDVSGNKFTLDGRTYYSSLMPLDAAGLIAGQALEVTGITRTQREILWTLIGSIVGVALIASLVGTVLARRIGRPLAHLAEAAGTLNAAEQGSPLVETRVREVALLAQALEGARADLFRSVADLRKEKAWTDHLLEAIVEGIVTLDRQGHITFFSNGAERVTGWRREEVVGRSCDYVFSPLESDLPFSQLIPAPGRRTKIPVELREGRQAILAVTGARLLPPEGGEARVALVFRDVSEEEAVHRLLGHFLANVAHEFRTPLSALAASVELLLDQAPDLSAAELQELLSSLHLGVLGLQTLTDNLLEGASIESGHFRVQPRPCGLGEMIAESIATMQPLLDKHGQRLVVELPAAIPVVQADPRRTVQVLINLLSNASKYGPDDSEIAIGAALSDGWVRISVADSGPGVPLDHRSDLFRQIRKPSRGDERTRLGAGLGLSVVKGIVEAHGGDVGIDDCQGGGAVFWFTLPEAGRP